MVNLRFIATDKDTIYEQAHTRAEGLTQENAIWRRQAEKADDDLDKDGKFDRVIRMLEQNRLDQLIQ